MSKMSRINKQVLVHHWWKITTMLIYVFITVDQVMIFLHISGTLILLLDYRTQTLLIPKGN